MEIQHIKSIIKQRKRLFLWALPFLALFLYIVNGRLQDRVHSSEPNIILIVIDTLRADHLGRYGYDRPTDVGFAEFYSSAHHFRDCYAPSSWTTPSTASIHSGLHPIRHGAYERNTRIPENIWTIAEILKRKGWKTGGFSFNHNVSDKTGFDQGFDFFDSFLGKVMFYPDITIMLKRAKAWVNRVSKKPFFLYLHPMNVHGPYRVPSDFQVTLLGRQPSRDFVYAEGWMRAIMTDGKIDIREEVSPEYITSLVEQYDSAIRYSSDRIGEFFAWLNDQGYFENSFIVITSDHGEELFDHGGFSHGYSLYEEVIKVPLSIKLPGQTSSKDVMARVTLLDIVPTIMEFLKLSWPYEIDGQSLLSLAQDTPDSEPSQREFLIEINWPNRCVARALLKGPTKFISTSSDYSARGGTEIMYDIAGDPGETKSLLPDTHPEFKAMKQQLAAFSRLMKLTAIGKPVDVSKELDFERLRSLGYVDIKK